MVPRIVSQYLCGFYRTKLGKKYPPIPQGVKFEDKGPFFLKIIIKKNSKPIKCRKEMSIALKQNLTKPRWIMYSWKGFGCTKRLDYVMEGYKRFDVCTTGLPNIHDSETGIYKISITPSLGGGNIKFMGKNIKLERVGLGKQYPFFPSSLRSN